MSWLYSIANAVITAVVGMLVIGFIGDLAAHWYRVPSREGASGYFVFFHGVFGLVFGLILGFVCSRIVTPGNGEFLRGLGVSLGVGLFLAGVYAAHCRLSADIAPTLGGEKLLLAIELRYPESQTQPPVEASPAPQLELIARVKFGKQPYSKHGPLRTANARLENGRWIVPGEVELHTERGDRILSIDFGQEKRVAFLVPLPRRPGRKFEEWSDWLPRPRPDGQPSPTPYAYRFRVQRVSQPMQTNTFGPFQIQLLASGFLQAAQGYIVCESQFRILHAGKPVSFLRESTEERHEPTEIVKCLGLIQGRQPALIAGVGEGYRSMQFFLVAEKEGALRVEPLSWQDDRPNFEEVVPGPSPQPNPAFQISNWTVLTSPDWIRVGRDTLVDPQTLMVQRIPKSDAFHMSADRRILTFSPDRRSLVRVGQTLNDHQRNHLVVIDCVGNRAYGLPLDPSHMRFHHVDQIDAEFIDHHFEWKRDAAGVDQLVERASFKPFRRRSHETANHYDYRAYRWYSGTEGLRRALEDYAQRAFGAVSDPEPGKLSDQYHRLRIDGVFYSVSFDPNDGQVDIFNERGKGLEVVTRIAKGFDAELATGKYDKLFK